MDYSLTPGGNSACFVLLGARSFHGNTAAATECGVDFFAKCSNTAESEFLTCRTQTVVPVDLNAFLYAHEKILNDLCGHVGKEKITKSLLLGVPSGGVSYNFTIRHPLLPERSVEST